ncbi:ABC transporter permease subunit [Alphaproteobacteria bacterium]|jgi:polar amino acid transport system permease protein|nr:ABC transporter permease subunit [Alphaproteobacteria bacterium]MDC3311114.1 ABC transporter permease subunit [Alphaproteobacteria bacterium]
MFNICANPSSLEGTIWLICYLTTAKHFAFYFSFIVVLMLLILAAPLSLLFGFAASTAVRSSVWFVRICAKAYINMVRGIPDVVFFLFVPLALDQLFELIRHKTLCSDVVEPIWRGTDFMVCSAAKLPLSTADLWVHQLYSFILALIAFAIVFGAFAGNVLTGAMKAVPKDQTDTAAAYGFTQKQIFWRILVPQMWVYAIPGLSNLWMILIKATPLLFLLGVEDIVYWARELGGSKTSLYAYPHPDWRVYYFAGLLIFYLSMTWVSEKILIRLQNNLSHGQATMAGKELQGDI